MRPIGLAAEQEVQGKSCVEGFRVIDLVDFVLRQLDAEGLDVALEMLDFAAADDRKDILN